MRFSFVMVTGGITWHHQQACLMFRLLINCFVFYFVLAFFGVLSYMQQEKLIVELKKSQITYKENIMNTIT